jgi:hypothetical protein
VSAATTTASVAVVVSTAVHDRAWWTEQSGRVGSDWDGIIEIHLSALAALGFIEQKSSE